MRLPPYPSNAPPPPLTIRPDPRKRVTAEGRSETIRLDWH